MLTAMLFFGMGGACVIAGLFGELVIRQSNPAQVRPVVVDTNQSSFAETANDSDNVDSSAELFDLLPPANDQRYALIGA